MRVLAKPGWTINDPTLPEGDVAARIAAVNLRLARIVTETVSAGQRPVSIAGDCLSAIGVLSGLQKAGINPFIIWFDAHGDFNTPVTSPSGFLGGMPLAMITGRGDLTIPRAVGLEPFPENRVILTDARDLDPEERIALRASDIVHLGDPKGLLQHSLPEEPLYVHLDTDVITPDEVPAQNYPAAGGLTAAELQAVFRRLSGESRLVAVSVSSWNPNLDHSRTGEQVSLALLKSLVGRLD